MKDYAPPKLYKYQSCSNYAFDNLRKRCLWFAKPESFNDPFDCNINFEIVDVTEENLRLLFERMRASARDKNRFDKKYLQNGQINELFSEDVIKFSLMATSEVKKMWGRVGVACFSEINDDILMWSHYSACHQGFCLEFDTTFSPFLEVGKDTVIRVHYSHSYPPLSLAAIVHNTLPPLPRNLLATKSPHWSYEAEWRVFNSIGGIEYSYDKSALTGVYFGCRMKESDKTTIVSILAESPTKLYQMQRSNSEFKVTPREIYSAR